MKYASSVLGSPSTSGASTASSADAAWYCARSAVIAARSVTAGIGKTSQVEVDALAVEHLLEPINRRRQSHQRPTEPHKYASDRTAVRRRILDHIVITHCPGRIERVVNRLGRGPPHHGVVEVRKVRARWVCHRRPQPGSVTPSATSALLSAVRSDASAVTDKSLSSSVLRFVPVEPANDNVITSAPSAPIAACIATTCW